MDVSQKSKLLHCKCEICGISIISPIKCNCCDYCYHKNLGTDISSFGLAEWFMIKLENQQLKDKLRRLIGL